MANVLLIRLLLLLRVTRVLFFFFFCRCIKTLKRCEETLKIKFKSLAITEAIDPVKDARRHL